MSRRVRTGLGALSLALLSVTALAAAAGAEGVAPDEAPAEATPTSTAETTPPTEAPAPPATEVVEVPAPEEPAPEQVVEEPVPEEVFEEPVEDEVFVEEDVFEEEVVEEELVEPVDEAPAVGGAGVTTTQLDFGPIDDPEAQGSTSSLVAVVEPEEATSGSDTSDVVRLVMALLVVVGLLVLTLTVRYWWYTSPRRGLAPSRAILPPGTDQATYAALLHPGGPPGVHAAADVPAPAYVGAAAAVPDGPFVDPWRADVGAHGPGMRPEDHESGEHWPSEDLPSEDLPAEDLPAEHGPSAHWPSQHRLGEHDEAVGGNGVTAAGPVADGQFVEAAGDEAIVAVPERSQARRSFVDHAAELDAEPTAEVVAVPVSDEGHPPAGLWHEPRASSLRGRLLEGGGDGSRGRAVEGAVGEVTVQASDVLSWVDPPRASVPPD